MASRPVLILEGPGDAEAVPELIRRISDYAVFPTPSPIRKQNVVKLNRQGELEKFVTYALRRDGDAVLILLDADEHCARDIAMDWTERLRALGPEKKVGLGLFVREYEAFFLACLDFIARDYPNYGWRLDDWRQHDNHEEPRGVKELLSRFMRTGRRYKPTLDQARFTATIDPDRLRRKCRSFRHLESLLQWLLDNGRPGDMVYPSVIG